MTAVATQAGSGVESDGERSAASAPLMDHRQIMLVIYGLMAAMFLSSMEQTVFGTAIRTIGDDLHGLDQQAWVTTAYLIAATVTTAKPSEPMLSDSESYFNDAIKKAVKAGDVDKALKLLDEAERLGSKTARKTFIESVKR